MLQHSHLQELVRFNDLQDALPFDLSKENIKKYINLKTAEYYLGGIEILLAIRFLVNFFSGYNKQLLVKIYEVITYPLAAPFSLFLGRNPSFGIERLEVDTLLAMLLWPVVIWSAVAYAKHRSHQQHLAS